MPESFQPPTPSETPDVAESPDVLANADQQLPLTVRLTAWHCQLLDYLKTQEADLWTWFSSHRARKESADAVRLDLLKTAYRLSPESATELYKLAEAVRRRMRIDAEVTLYQAQHAVGLNASLAWLPTEVHVVLHGPVQETLTDEELSALLAHEFAHHELYSIDDGACLVMEQILSAMISDQAADAPYDRTWRSHRLYTELHCDRRAAEVTEDLAACVRALVKMETGLKSVSAEAYLQQAEEVLSKGELSSEGVTHPEMFIRARALQLWQEDPDRVDERLQDLVEGPLQLNQLDLLRQHQMVQLTRDLLLEFLVPEWLRTDLMLGHAKRFFEDFPLLNRDSKPSVDPCVSNDQSLRERVAACDAELQKYVCYVLLDFVTCDPDLEECPLAAAFLLTEKTGLASTFRELAAQELKLGKRALLKVEADAAAIVQQAASE